MCFNLHFATKSWQTTSSSYNISDRVGNLAENSPCKHYLEGDNVKNGPLKKPKSRPWKGKYIQANINLKPFEWSLKLTVDKHVTNNSPYRRVSLSNPSQKVSSMLFVEDHQARCPKTVPFSVFFTLCLIAWRQLKTSSIQLLFKCPRKKN